MKRFGLLLLVVTALVMSGNAGDLYAAPAAKPLILKVASWMPAHVPHGRSGIWLVQEVERKSQGRVKMEYYWSNSLVPAKQLIDALQKGVADIAFINPAYQPGKLPLLTVNTLPATSPGEYYPTAKALEELMQMPEIRAELDKLNIRYLGPLPNTTYGIWTSKKQVRHVADLKGLKIRTLGLMDNLLHALGGVPVSLGATEIYQAIEKGTLDGGAANPSMALGYKWEEVTKYYYPIAFGNVAMFVGVNKDSWKKIPPDIQAHFTALHDIACGVAHQIYQGEGERMLDKFVAEGKITVTQPSPEDFATVRKVAKEKIWADWVNKMNKKGLPGQKVMDRWLELLAKWHGESPFK
jgi:TRAP-type C4-dicarboxylate transport system substrate-binding protein